MLVFPDALNANVVILRMLFTPPKCKMLMQDWIESEPNVVLTGDQPDEASRFS